MTKAHNHDEPDYILFILASALIVIGIVFSYSLSVYTVLLFDYNDLHFFIRQLVYGILGIAIMYWFLDKNPYYYIGKIGMFLFIGGLILIVVMPILPAFLVTESGGAKRWIKFPGISLSPVEFFKLGFIYFLAWSFNRRVVNKSPARRLFEEYILFLPYFTLFLFVIIFVAYFQKDLGQSFVLALILLIFIIFANRSKRLLFSLFLIGVMGFVLLIFIAGHRIKRIAEWWAMHQDTLLGLFPNYMQEQMRVVGYEEPYQVGHSLNAIANGGFTGEGIGNGFLKMGFLSEVHTDFILAGIAEEVGVVGIFIILSLMIAICWRIFRISNRVKNNVFHFFALGVGIMLIGAFFINAFGITGIIPIKGIAVPFLSYGGSSIIASSIAIGLVLSISKTARDKTNLYDFDDEDMYG